MFEVVKSYANVDRVVHEVLKPAYTTREEAQAKADALTKDSLRYIFSGSVYTVREQENPHA